MPHFFSSSLITKNISFIFLCAIKGPLIKPSGYNACFFTYFIRLNCFELDKSLQTKQGSAAVLTPAEGWSHYSLFSRPQLSQRQNLEGMRYGPSPDHRGTGQIILMSPETGPLPKRDIRWRWSRCCKPIDKTQRFSCKNSKGRWSRAIQGSSSNTEGEPAWSNFSYVLPTTLSGNGKVRDVFPSHPAVPKGPLHTRGSHLGASTPQHLFVYLLKTAMK